MTRNPDGLRTLEQYFRRQIGPYWLGTVGDEDHLYGYHLGAFECPIGDYSTVLQRDIDGINKYGGYWASATDIGMGWRASRDWLKWLTNETNRGKFRDIREIIGSTDGRMVYRWDVPSGQVHTEGTEEHIGHTHISWHRDSIFRNQTAIFQGWSRSGRTLPKPSTITKLGSKPAPVIQPKGIQPAGENSSHGFNPLWGIPVGAVAWIIKRRMELARENSEQNSG